jgi:hypothetical protein
VKHVVISSQLVSHEQVMLSKQFMVNARVVNILVMHRTLFKLGHRNWCDACLICSLKESLLKSINLNGYLLLHKEMVIR